MDVAGELVPIVWQGRRSHAFVPALLSERDLPLSPATVRHLATAAAQVDVGAASMPADYEPLARLLLRAEGVASSYLEGLAAPLADVVLAESSHPSPSTTAAWIAANLAVVGDAIAAADTPLSLELLCTWHERLTEGSPLPRRLVGRLRTEQGWIGGSSPFDAALVTPPPDRLDELLDDLCSYANRTDVDPICHAAVAHAQFELIHPFGDGNGRIGRVLVTWMLTRRLALVTPPPVSIRIAADRDGYLSGLTLFRLGQHEPWVRWFADVVTGAGRAQQQLVRQVDELQATWRERLAAGKAPRSDAVAWQVLELLPRHLVLDASLVAGALSRSTRSGRDGLQQLAAADILTEHVPATRFGAGRPSRRFVAPELLDLVGSARTSAGGRS